MPVTSDKSAPYAPASAIIVLIERHRSRGLPTPVNAEVLARAGISDSLIPRTLQALVALDLIDKDGKISDTLEAIRLAPETEYKQRLAEWLNTAYADVIKFVDPGTDNETAVRDAFRNYQPMGQQARMVSLFLGLYAAAGVAAEKSKQAQPRRTRLGATQSNAARKPRTVNKPRNNTPGSSAGLPDPIAGLLSSLPNPAVGWTQEQRDRFISTFGAVLDYCIPVVGVSELSDDDNEEITA